jgi:hypothetical protein
MRLIEPKIRVMREELKKDTDEIRETYDLPGFRSNVTYHVRGELQNRHMHLLLGGGHHTLDGSMEIQDDDGKWHRLDRRHASSYKPGEFYNTRVPIDAPNVKYPDAGPTIGAVSVFYKYIWPGTIISKEETPFLFNNDWFGETFLNDPTDKRSSPALRLGEAEQKRFWEIVRRNTEILGSKWERFKLSFRFEIYFFCKYLSFRNDKKIL